MQNIIQSIKKLPYNNFLIAALLILTYVVFASPLGSLCIVIIHQQINYQQKAKNSAENKANKLNLALSITNAVLYFFSYFHKATKLLCIISMSISILCYAISVPKKNQQKKYFNSMDIAITVFVSLTLLPYLSSFAALRCFFISDLTVNIILAICTAFSYLKPYEQKIREIFFAGYQGNIYNLLHTHIEMFAKKVTLKKTENPSNSNSFQQHASDSGHRPSSDHTTVPPREFRI